MDTLDMEHYEREGWAVVEGVFSGEECEELVAHMLDLHAGKKALEGFAPREADQLQRTHNQQVCVYGGGGGGGGRSGRVLLWGEMQAFDCRYCYRSGCLIVCCVLPAVCAALIIVVTC